MIVAWIKCRSAPFHFTHIEKGVLNAPLKDVMEMAEKGAALPLLNTPHGADYSDPICSPIQLLTADRLFQMRENNAIKFVLEMVPRDPAPTPISVTAEASKSFLRSALTSQRHSLNHSTRLNINSTECLQI
jgi:hypothetical protein